MTYCGIDPGDKGAITMLYPETNEVEIYPISENPDYYDWYQILYDYGPSKIALEDIWVRSMQKGMTKFITGFGCLVLSCKILEVEFGTEFKIVAPHVWQPTFVTASAFSSRKKGVKDKKKIARIQYEEKKKLKERLLKKAETEFPDVEWDKWTKEIRSGCADSALLALYAKDM